MSCGSRSKSSICSLGPEARRGLCPSNWRPRQNLQATGVEAVASVRNPVDPRSPEALGSVQLLLCPERLPLAQ